MVRQTDRHGSRRETERWNKIHIERENRQNEIQREKDIQRWGERQIKRDAQNEQLSTY